MRVLDLQDSVRLAADAVLRLLLGAMPARFPRIAMRHRANEVVCTQGGASPGQRRRPIAKPRRAPQVRCAGGKREKGPSEQRAARSASSRIYVLPTKRLNE